VIIAAGQTVAPASLRLRSGQALPAVPRASRPRRGGRGRPPDSRRDGGATSATRHAHRIPRVTYDALTVL